MLLARTKDTDCVRYCGLRSVFDRAFLLVTLLLLPWSSLSDVPQHLNHQGVLTDEAGVTVEDGTYQLRFEIFDAPTLGTALFSQTLSVEVRGGLYNVLLSSNGSWDLEAAFLGTGNRYLAITIVTSPGGGLDGVELQPRQQFGSVPYALVAPSSAEGLVPAGAIILWDQSDECPPGFSEATEFRGLLARGADRAASLAGVPESAGQTCANTPDAQCDAAAEGYDDSLSLGELAPHDHEGFGDEQTGWPFGEVGPGNMGQSGSIDFDNHFYKTSTAGAGDPHYHPFRTVLFCRKD